MKTKKMRGVQRLALTIAVCLLLLTMVGAVAKPFLVVRLGDQQSAHILCLGDELILTPHGSNRLTVACRDGSG